MRNLPGRFLSDRCPPQTLQKVVKPVKAWHPYPTYEDRGAWECLPEGVRMAHIARAEQALADPWPHLPAVQYLNFARNGNRREYERPYFKRRDLVGRWALAECLENRGKYLDAIADGIWSICEESSWCVPAHIGVQERGTGLPDVSEPVVDLFAAETGALLAWVDYLLRDRLDSVSPLIRERIRREVNLRILTPTLERDDFGWMGFTSLPVNNWNPWVNSNWLTCALLLETDPQRRLAAVSKILESLDCFLVPYPRDGGCDEGPGYWGRAGASVFDALDLLFSVSGGQINLYDQPLIQEIGRFVYRAHIDGDYYVNFADAPARLTPDPMLVFRYGKRIGDPIMTAFGAWLADRKQVLAHGVTAEGDVAPSLGRVLPALFTLHQLPGEVAWPAYQRVVWLPDIQVMACRDVDGSPDGFYLAAKGGHNQESHNHNDVGHFLIYHDGKPLIIDVGVETYTRKTFSPQRYEIWTMQSAFHSLPSIDGIMQAPGIQYAAREVAFVDTQVQTGLTLDIAGAYPPSAGLVRWRRSVCLVSGQGVRVEDAWQMARSAAEIAFHLVTPCEVDLQHRGAVMLREAQLEDGRVSGTALIQFQADKMVVEVEKIVIEDPRLQFAWGHDLARLTFRYLTPPLDGEAVFEFRPIAP